VPLQALSTPIAQLPIICAPSVILALGVCAFIIGIDTDNESKLIPIIKINNIMALNGKIDEFLFLSDPSFAILSLIDAFQHKST
jgi:hypothetical protein